MGLTGKTKRFVDLTSKSQHAIEIDGVAQALSDGDPFRAYSLMQEARKRARRSGKIPLSGDAAARQGADARRIMEQAGVLNL